MNRIIRIAPLLVALAFCVSPAHAGPKRETLVQRITNSEYALEEIMTKAETKIPASILQDAKGIILTVNYRGSLFLGGHGGRGVLVVKNPLTGEWGVPAFVKLGGANFGLQLGVKEFDTVYLIMNDEMVRKAYTGRFDFSADAAIAAGPVGSMSEANDGEDYQNANILVYTTVKGLFAGIAIKAGWVSPHNSATKKFYETEYNTPEIVLSDWFEMPEEATSLIQRLNYYMEGGT